MNAWNKELDGRELLEGLQQFAEHLQGKRKLTLRVTSVPLPPPIASIGPTDVKAIREKLNLSQPVFAAWLNVPVVTAISWERGRRRPTGAALRLLDIARRHPEILAAG